MHEHRKQPLLSRARFTKRVFRHFILALLFLAVGLGIGVLGYHSLGELNWIDSLLNASMILGAWGLLILSIRRRQKYLLPVTLCFPDWLL